MHRNKTQAVTLSGKRVVISGKETVHSFFLSQSPSEFACRVFANGTWSESDADNRGDDIIDIRSLY
jgi:hypothetical protein